MQLVITETSKKIVKWGVVLFVLIGLIIIYKVINPVTHDYFPKCPLKQFIGIKCPGCGSQRAVHYLLNFEVGNAFKENMLLVLSLPYIITGFIFDMVKTPNERFLKWRKRLFGTKAIFSILIIILLFWILRNTGWFTTFS